MAICAMPLTSMAYSEHSVHGNLKIQLQNVEVDNTKINIQGQAEREIMPDTINITLSVLENGNKYSEVQDNINKKVKSILDILQANKALEISAESYVIYPNKDKNKNIVNYEGFSNIKIVSKNFDETFKALQETNDLAFVKDTYFSISKKLQKKIKDELLQDAIENFKEKAKKISSLLGQDKYNIEVLNINDSGFGIVRPMMYKASAVSMGANQEIQQKPEMKLIPQKQNIQVNVNGTIILKGE